jgi:hypothetical protein
MKIRSTIIATLAAASVACTNPVDTEAPTSSPLAAPIPMAAMSTVAIGNAVTVSDAGWKSSFGGSMTVEADATVIYAMVFGGSGGAAPVTGVSVGSQALTKVKSIMGPNALSLDVYRLTAPSTGSGRAITVTRSSLGYDPVRVTVFTVRGADASNPNGAMANLEITPGTATATKTASISSSSGSLTISGVVAAGTYLNGTGITATPGYQSVVATGEDADGGWGVIGSAPGAASVTHSWSLKADAAGRSAFLVSFTVNPSGGTASPTPTDSTPPPSSSAPAGIATFGTVVTLTDNGWVQPFTGTLQVESDATVAYAVVFNGSGGNAPISSVSLGGRAFTKIKAAERTLNAALEVYRLVAPPVGSQSIAVTHSKLGYDPVRVSVFTVRGASTTTPNGTVTEVDITPASATSTRTASIWSGTDGLTISAVAASNTYLNGSGITATQGFQVMRSAGEDADGQWGALGSAAGNGGTVVHSYTLKADAAGRSAYLVSFTVNGATGAPAPPPPPPPPPALPVASDGFTTVLDYDVAQAPVPTPGSYEGWVAYERPWEQTLFTNLSTVFDSTQPGTGSAGAARVKFLTTLPPGYAPVTFAWAKPWPVNTGSLDMTFTIKLSANWDNNGARNTSGGCKLWFFAKERQNNHYILLDSRTYDGGGVTAAGGNWLTIGLQNPTLSYKTNMNLAPGVWHTVRVQVIANTPGVANGRLRVWVDGVQALINTGRNDKPLSLERTNVMFYSAGQVAEQSRLQLEPTYGGTESAPATQWFDIGRVTAAVR